MKFISEAAWREIQATLEAYRQDNRNLLERIDRLTESLARKSGASLYMPQQKLPPPQEIFGEKSPGWFDLKPPVVVPPAAPRQPKTED